MFLHCINKRCVIKMSYMIVLFHEFNLLINSKQMRTIFVTTSYKAKTKIFNLYHFPSNIEKIANFTFYDIRVPILGLIDLLLFFPTKYISLNLFWIERSLFMSHETSKMSLMDLKSSEMLSLLR